MGYRSDVAVVIYGDQRDPEKYELLKTLMNTTFEEVLTEFDAEWHDTKHVLEFEMDNVKWYDGYPDVDRFMHMLDDIGDIEGFNYELMRVGEDTEDIEHTSRGGDVDCVLSVSRSIEVDL